jgi:hypothetical protein
MSFPIPTPIYHITHLQNLEGIIQAGNLWAKNLLSTGAVSVAYEHIQERRSMRAVPVPPHGVLHDYVPFYFCPRSPMLYAIHNPGPNMHYQGGQKQILHLTSNVEAVSQATLHFVVTDRHAVLDYAEFFESADAIPNLCWDHITATTWKNTPSCPDRKERKQAEFLVHQFMPWNLFTEIGVINQHIKNEVQRVLHATSKNSPGPKPTVTVHRDWYY